MKEFQVTVTFVENNLVHTFDWKFIGNLYMGVPVKNVVATSLKQNT